MGRAIVGVLFGPSAWDSISLSSFVSSVLPPLSSLRPLSSVSVASLPPQPVAFSSSPSSSYFEIALEVGQSPVRKPYSRSREEAGFRVVNRGFGEGYGLEERTGKSRFGGGEQGLR